MSDFENMCYFRGTGLDDNEIRHIFRQYDYNSKKLEKLLSKKCDKNSYEVRKIYVYEYPSGKLTSVEISTGIENSYIFDTKGNLIYQWIYDKCYDAKGKEVDTLRLF